MNEKIFKLFNDLSFITMCRGMWRYRGRKLVSD
jgi:hypothetical protein